jgi:hypothetical protein
MSLIEPAKIKQKPLKRDAFNGYCILAYALDNGSEIRRRYNRNAYAPFRLIIRIGNREFRCEGIEIINPVSINSSYENGSCKMIHGRTENCAKMIDIVKVDKNTKIKGVFFEV